MKMPDDIAPKLLNFKVHNPHIATIIENIFEAERDKLRFLIEYPLGNHNDYVNAGRAQAFKEASEIFKDAAKAVENIQKRKQSG